MDDKLILEECFEKIRKYIQDNSSSSLPVVKYNSPSALNTKVDFTISEDGISEEYFLGLVDKYLDYSVRTGNKQFLNQLYSGFNFPAFIGEVFTALANTSMYTYEVAPVATLIETEMIRLMNEYVGYPDGDGVFLSGGSNANLIAMFSARNRALPGSRFHGYNSRLQLKAFVNEQAHYSFETAANVLGIGAKNVLKIKADNNGRMIPDELEQAIKRSFERGERPFFVGATCATTLVGAYDPLREIAAICAQDNVWLHADGSFGGSLLLSKKYGHLLNGSELTDSFAWNPHKLMNIPLICSALLVKKRGILQQNITDINTDYIFHDIDHSEDLGKKSIQCGRRVDAVKLWFAWKYFGRKGYEKRIDNLMEMAAYAEEKTVDHPRLELLIKRQSFAVCFRYIPEFESDINKFNLELREHLRKTGKSIVNYGYIGKKLAIRLITANTELYKCDIDEFFENLLTTAGELEAKYTL